MFKPIFDNPGIVWLVYQPTADSSSFELWLFDRPHDDAVKLTARMRRFAELADWNARIPSIKQLDLPGKLKGRGIALYEVKSYQDRVLFVRAGNNAIIVGQMVKKDDWSKRDARELEKAIDTAQEYLKLHKNTNTKGKNNA